MKNLLLTLALTLGVICGIDAISFSEFKSLGKKALGGTKKHLEKATSVVGAAHETYDKKKKKPTRIEKEEEAENDDE